ncbi:hypothetical protein HDR70_04880 [bacterium]|nr:hypothetical protein [bacterium]
MLPIAMKKRLKISKYEKKYCKNTFLLENKSLNLQRVFHGIRFKVRGLVVGRQLIFFYLSNNQLLKLLYTRNLQQFLNLCFFLMKHDATR